MNKKQKIILLSVISVIFVALLSIGLTTAFMKPIEQGGNLTEIALSSCAKIKLTSTSSINLSNTYPMSRNKGFETSPYNFTITSYCDTYVGFNLYIATLSTNTLDASNIHYILTYKGSKNVIKEGILSSVTSGVSDFSDTEKTELNTGLKGTYGSIYKLYSESLALKGSKEYSLYLYVDENATNTTMGKTFNAGVAVKSYDREIIGLEMCNTGQNLSECIISAADLGSDVSKIYYHDSILANGAGDNSYRYAGPSDSVNNFVCFGSNVTPCPYDNLYRIIQVTNFQITGDLSGDDEDISGIDPMVKLIKYDYMTTNELGTNGDYYGAYTYSDATYKGNNYANIASYYWNYKADTSRYPNGSNTWSTSLLNKTNLNTNFINYLGTEWANKIATATWKVGGNALDKIANATPSVAYQNEIVNPTPGSTSINGETEYSAKIGLMYVSDYGYAASPSVWASTMASYNEDAAYNNNWMYMGLKEWTLSRSLDSSRLVFIVYGDGDVNNYGVYNSNAVRAVFYLEPTVKYISGMGTMSDPIRIN